MMPSDAEKAVYVNRMFAAIARRYDLMNRLMTGGRDRAWRQYVIRLAQLPPGGWLLDVATGTGEIGYEALRQVPDAHVVGVDFTHEMILIGQQKRHRGTIQFVEGNACRLPFADDAFDVVTSGFAMRNVADIHTAFAEQRRVAKPGGRVICLETTPPPHGLWGAIYRLYFFHLVPIVGGLLTGRRDAYAYLPRSTERFPSPEALKAIMEAVGLRHVRYRPLTLGTVVVHMGIK